MKSFLRIWRTVLHTRRIWSGFVLAAALLAMSGPAAWAEDFAGGSGTAGDPYIITTAEHLNNVRNDLTAYYRLGADIDLSGLDWEPIGNDASPFEGYFDGNGYTISGLRINDPDYWQGTGFFRNTGSDAVLVNISLSDVDIFGRDIVGGLVGVNNGSISGCSVEGTISGWGYLIVGGLVGQNYGPISDSHAVVTMRADSIQEWNAGGLAGWNYDFIICSYADVNISCNNGNVGIQALGGIAGYNQGSIIVSYATGSIEQTGGGYYSECGGLVGINSGTISSSYAKVDVRGDSDVGGLVGWHKAGIISSCYALGPVSGSNRVGGLIGSMRVRLLTPIGIPMQKKTAQAGVV